MHNLPCSSVGVHLTCISDMHILPFVHVQVLTLSPAPSCAVSISAMLGPHSASAVPWLCPLDKTADVDIQAREAVQKWCKQPAQDKPIFNMRTKLKESCVDTETRETMVSFRFLLQPTAQEMKNRSTTDTRGEHTAMPSGSKWHCVHLGPQQPKAARLAHHEHVVAALMTAAEAQGTVNVGAVLSQSRRIKTGTLNGTKQFALSATKKSTGSDRTDGCSASSTST